MSWRKITAFLSEHKFISSIVLLIILYSVGIAGIAFGKTRNLVLSLSAANIIISVIILLWNHKGSIVDIAPGFFIAFATGLAVEIVGVNTGWPFGVYSYGENLGIKIMGVPWVIGINWFYLTYAFSAILKFIRNIFIRSLGVAALMVAFDIIMEIVAPRLDYWSFEASHVPIANYLSWLVIGFIISIAVNISAKAINNRLAVPLIVIQLIFFIIIFALL